ncbi:endonuclease [Haliangium sp.]|uniref:endonuclease n=1 Tax=Haliangium sp. TaxID=2663208 RepID=UPI003D11236B
MSKLYLACAGAFALTACVAEPVDVAPDADKVFSPEYYASVDDSNATALRATVHEVIDDHLRLPYTSSATDVWDVLAEADADPSAVGKILDVYHNSSFPEAHGGNSFYNREHLWPKSIGFPKDGVSNYPYTDAHHLFAADSRYNSARSNKHFEDCSSSCSEFVTEVNDGTGGGSGVHPGNSNWTSGSGTGGRWEVWPGRRGDVARAIFYMDLRYEGGTHGVTGVAEPNLRLTDDVSLIVADSKVNRSEAFMGKLSTLLRWHEEDPVDEKELVRNDIVASFQGNRNPFIDHPEWVACVYEDVCGKPGGGDDTAEVWINEIHYDNAGSDVDEGVEIAGVAGLDLSGWSLVLYNGNGGGAYTEVSLSGTIVDQEGGAGTRWFPISGIQNGAPDGIALVSPTGELVQFLGYEGQAVAAGGAADGVTSIDIGVAESTSTPIGHTLQLVGSGCSAADFTWAVPAAGTRDAVNADQRFDCR